MNTPLPLNATRCYDDRCEVKEYCLRWIDRKRSDYVAMTLRKGWEPHDELCAKSIAIGERYDPEAH